MRTLQNGMHAVHIHSRSTTAIGSLEFFTLGLNQTSDTINTQGFTENLGTFSEIVKRNVESKIARKIWGRLMNHIY